MLGSPAEALPRGNDSLNFETVYMSCSQNSPIELIDMGSYKRTD